MSRCLFSLMLFIMCLSPRSSMSDDCAIRQDCHFHHFETSPPPSFLPSTNTDRKSLPHVLEIDEFNQKTRKGEWKAREGELPKHILAAWAQSTEGWCANCSREKRNLDKYYKYRHGVQDLDITRFPIVDKLKLLANQHVLLLGDSLMRQIFYSLFWLFPGSFKRDTAILRM